MLYIATIKWNQAALLPTWSEQMTYIKISKVYSNKVAPQEAHDIIRKLWLHNSQGYVSVYRNSK